LVFEASSGPKILESKNKWEKIFPKIKKSVSRRPTDFKHEDLKDQ